MSKKFAAVILAAGQGKRMKSDLPKVLHQVQGRPMIHWVVDAAQKAGADEVVVVLGHGREEVRAVLPARVKDVLQDRQMGTGHAAKCTESMLKNYPGPIAVLCGDVPLLSAERIAKLVESQQNAQAAVVVLSAVVGGEHAYGRVVRDKAGNFLRIVEHKDASDEVRKIQEINTGTYAFAPGKLFPALAELKNNNAQGEFYLTDTVGWFAGRQEKVVAEVAPCVDECLGVNTPEDLEACEKILKERKV